MKSITKSILIFIVLVGTSYLSLAQTQVPEKMSFQAVIRNSSGQLVSTQTVGMQISILQGTASGTSVYVETHTPTTNINGLVSLEIGAGIAQSGNFSAIDWANGPYFIKTETDIDGGTNYTISGTSQLLSVPYALHAKTAETVVGGISEIDPEFNASVAAGITSADTANWNDKFSGDYNDLTNTPTNVSTFTNDAGYITSYTETDPVFGTSVAAGITSADTANWNSKLNNFIESDTMLWKKNGNDIYFNTGKVGIGTNTPSYKLETTEDVLFNGVRVGRGSGNNLSNTVVGYNALADNSGFSNTSIGVYSLNRSYGGSGNTAIGSESMQECYGGNQNTAIGVKAGWTVYSGSGNVFIGYEAGKWESGSNKLYISNSETSTPLIYGDFSSGRVGIGTNNPTFKFEVTSDVSFNGVRVGRGSGNLAENTIIGNNALLNNTSGNGNVALGSVSLMSNVSGWYNVALGFYSLNKNTSGNYNVAVGVGTLENLTSGGNNNTALGHHSGHKTTGSGNVFIGYEAGKWETGSNKLYISNSETSTPLIYGDFSTGNIGLGTNNPQYKLDITGDINFTGDIRKNGTPLVMDGSETKINAGSDITIIGNGTTATPYIINAAKPKFYLGQDTLGGIVFYVYLGADGQQHGLIVSKTETTAQWQSSSSTTNADRSWDGAYNMNLMTNSPAKDWITANFSSDWYLPSIDELNILWQSRFHANKALNANGFTLLSNTARYWSSTEGGATTAWDFTFGDGNVGNFGKTSTHTVRPIRAF
jgi:hypothetical protein